MFTHPSEASGEPTVHLTIVPCYSTLPLYHTTLHHTTLYHNADTTVPQYIIFCVSLCPRYKWGAISHHSIGTVQSLNRNGIDVTVNFPEQKNWTGVISEMELVPGMHPRHRLEVMSRPSLVLKIV